MLSFERPSGQKPRAGLICALIRRAGEQFAGLRFVSTSHGWRSLALSALFFNTIAMETLGSTMKTGARGDVSSESSAGLDRLEEGGCLPSPTAPAARRPRSPRPPRTPRIKEHKLGRLSSTLGIGL